VAQDGRLVLLREQGAPGLTLERGGRSLEVPEEKPVFVLDKDALVLGRRIHLRLHVHGAADRIVAPQPLDLNADVDQEERRAPRWLLAGAAAVVLGASAGFGGTSGAPSEPQSRPATDAAARRPDAGPTSRPIEVREVPPVPPPPPPPTGCGGCSKEPPTAEAPRPRRVTGR
jgi:hypothetical protein